MNEQPSEPRRDEQRQSERAGEAEQSRSDEREWEEGIGRGEEYGAEGQRERAQGDMYGQEQRRSAGPSGREREDPPQGWYGRQRQPSPENFPRSGRSQRGEQHQGTQGGYEQGHRGGYEKGYRGSQSGYEQDYEQLPSGGKGRPGQSFGGPGYQDRGSGGRADRGEGWRREPGGTGWREKHEETGKGHRGRGPKNYVRSDERICEEINDLLMESDEVDPSEVEVYVEHGEVILRGTAHSREEKRRMEDIASSVLGVEEVLNHLRIRRYDDQGREEWSRERKPDSGGREPGPSRH